jgi:hypothetical protein
MDGLDAEFAAILTQTSHVFTVDVDRSGLYVESYRPSNAYLGRVGDLSPSLIEEGVGRTGSFG